MSRTFRAASVWILLFCNTETDAVSMHLNTFSRSSKIMRLLPLWFPLAVHAALSFQERCLSFTPEVYIHNSSRHVLTYVAAGTNLILADNDPTCNRSSQPVAVDLCRVGLSIPTSKRSSISFELWLPEDWSDRFLVTGNGGIDGCESFIILSIVHSCLYRLRERNDR